VKVVAHAMQRYAVWFGGSLAASTVREMLKKINIYFVLFSQISMKYVIQEQNMKKKVQAFVVTMPYLILCERFFSFLLFACLFLVLFTLYRLKLSRVCFSLL
jgi:hypothetical protein